jgi:Right handed beta helix region
LNTYSGNGSALSKLASGASNNFGVGLVGTSHGNLIEKNKIGGNLNGVLIMASTQGGNIIRRNIIAGNPPADFGAANGADIQDLSAPGTNTFEDNRCLTYAGSLQPAPCPSISKPDDDEDRQEREIAAFGRNRLAFPQARMVNAVFHMNGGALPKIAGAPRDR